MTQRTFLRSSWMNTASLLLLLPATYVIFICILKYGLGVDAPFDSSASFLESMGIKDPPGWNISSVIAFGPVLALAIAAWQVLVIRWHFGKERWEFNIIVQKKTIPLFLVVFSTLVLLTLSVYLIGENFRAI